MNEEFLNFCHSILNIRKNDDEIIIQIVKKNKKELEEKTDDVSGFCKFIANNISIDLTSNHIRHTILNTKELIGGYEHVFILVKSLNNYILIDPTYIQFKERKETVLNSKLDNWPASELLKSEQGQKIYEELIKLGFTFIDDDSFKLYLSSFNKNIKFDKSLDELTIGELLKKR